MEKLMHSMIRNRRLLVAGKGDPPDSKNGTKVTFHFKTVAIYTGNESTSQPSSGHGCCPLTQNQADGCEKPPPEHEHGGSGTAREIVVDDSKSANMKPMELFYGHQFKFQLWEEWLKNMRIGERSQLTIDWRLCESVYPLLSKSYRNFCSPPSRIYETETTRAQRSNHCCGGMQNSAHKPSLGYKDLDCLVEHPPSKVEFTLELISVETPNQTDKEVWLMNDNDMLATLPELRKEAGERFANKDYKNAAEKYRKSLAILEQLQMKEKPNDKEWNDLEKQKVPCLSNLAQCELFLGEYYEALEHSDEAYKKDTGNVKALFRRAKANLAVWNFNEARTDFDAVKRMDPSLQDLVRNQLIILEQREKEKKLQEGNKFKGKLFG